MRMNYRKRLWPVLALLPVFALAAVAMSIGLPGVNTPTAEAQTLPSATTDILTVSGDKCGFTIEDGGGSGAFLFSGAATVTHLMQGGPCRTTGDSVTVEVTNENAESGQTDDSVTALVYVTGGDEFPSVQAGGAGAGAYGKKGVDELQWTLAAPVTNAFGTTNAKESVTVTRSMAAKGDVYLLFYRAGLPAPNATPLPTGTPAPTVLPALLAGGASRVLKVEFLGDPALKLASDMTMSASTLVAGDPNATTRQAAITLTIKDANGKLLNQSATLTVGGGEDIQFAQTNDKTRTISGEADGVLEATVMGLPRTGALRVPVNATVGDLELPTAYIVRIGDEAAAVSVKGYLCTAGGEGDDEDEDLCVDEKVALGTTPTNDDPEALGVVAPGSYILLAGNATDAAGNKDESLTLKWSAADAEILARASTSDVGFAQNPDDADDGLDFAVIQVASNATLGEYNLTVEDADDNASATVTFTVTGDATSLEITGPDVIAPASGLGVYTVTATDANGNVPINVVDDPDTTAMFDGIRVNIIVRAAGNPTVTGLKADGTLDFASNGVANFTIVVPYGTRLGSPINIVASGGALNATFSSTYGTEPEMLGPATGLTATSSATGTVALSWTAGTGSTRHFVAGVRKSEHEAGNYANIIWTAASSNSGHTVTGLTDGAVYLFTVISGDATMWSTWHRIVEVTVNPTTGGGGPVNPFG